MSRLIFAKLDPAFFGNRKILRAGRNGREVFLAALCMNAGRGAPGWIPAQDLEPWYVAHYLRISEADARDGVTKAIEAGLLRLDSDRVLIVGWDDDWARRPQTRAEIQQSYRDRQKNRYSNSVTRDVESNALPIRGEERRGEREPRNAEDSLSASPDSGSSAAKSEQPRKPRRAGPTSRPLPSDWQPGPTAVDFAQARDLDVAHEAEQFRLNAKAHGHTYVDPDAAFQKFMAGSRDVGKRVKKPKNGAVTREPKRIRTRTEAGVLLEENDDGELVAVGERAGADGFTEQAANRGAPHGNTT